MRHGEVSMFIAMNRFNVLLGQEGAFEAVWLGRDTQLAGVPGLRAISLSESANPNRAGVCLAFGGRLDRRFKDDGPLICTLGGTLPLSRTPRALRRNTPGFLSMMVGRQNPREGERHDRVVEAHPLHDCISEDRARPSGGALAFAGLRMRSRAVACARASVQRQRAVNKGIRAEYRGSAPCRRLTRGAAFKGPA